MVNGSFDKTVKLWNLKTRKLLHTLTRHSDFVRAVAKLQSPETSRRSHTGQLNLGLIPQALSPLPLKCEGSPVIGGFPLWIVQHLNLCGSQGGGWL